MNEPEKFYVSYRFRIVILSTALSLLIYLCGSLIMFKVSWIAGVVFLLYVLFLEFRLIKNHCSACYYRGRTCGFGRGGLSSLLFKQRDNSEFCRMTITWKSMIPDMLVSLIPVISGIILIIRGFDLIILFLVAVIIFLTTAGNGFIRSQLTCRYCKQRELGCPAEKLFDKK